MLFWRRENHHALYLRNAVFGVEDSLVSTVGVLSGVSAAGVERSTVLLTGIVIIFVEAFSMGVGSLLTENSVEEYVNKKEIPLRRSLLGAGVMLLSYFFAGFIPLFPYVFLPGMAAFWVSIFTSILSLGILGAINSKLSGTNLLRHSLEMMLIGGTAIAVGVGIGRIIQLP